MRGSQADRVSEACQINDLDHGGKQSPIIVGVSEACQINDLDHRYTNEIYSQRVSEACQINDLDHPRVWLQSVH